jgi:hypothetical protein
LSCSGQGIHQLVRHQSRLASQTHYSFRPTRGRRGSSQALKRLEFHLPPRTHNVLDVPATHRWSRPPCSFSIIADQCIRSNCKSDRIYSLPLFFSRSRTRGNYAVRGEAQVTTNVLQEPREAGTQCRGTGIATSGRSAALASRAAIISYAQRSSGQRMRQRPDFQLSVRPLHSQNHAESARRWILLPMREATHLYLGTYTYKCWFAHGRCSLPGFPLPCGFGSVKEVSLFW